MSVNRNFEWVIHPALEAVVVMVIWLIVTAVVYGGFVLLWTVDPAVGIWAHLGVYLFPFVGYLAHMAAWVRRR